MPVMAYAISLPRKVDRVRRVSFGYNRNTRGEPIIAMNVQYRFKVIKMHHMFMVLGMLIAFFGLMLFVQVMGRSYVTPEVYPNFGRFVI